MNQIEEQTTPKKHPEEKPMPIAKDRLTWLKDLLGIVLFVAAVIIGATIINAVVVRSFSVVGPSMEDTLYTGERIWVNRLPVTAAILEGREYIPQRGEIIVFTNPLHEEKTSDKYIVKRVIGLPGERVTVNDCVLMVYNQENPNGFNPYLSFNVNDQNTCVSGEKIDYTVKSHEIFVVGDHRNGSYSYDSRSGLGTLGSEPAGIPLDDVIGPVSVRILPIDKFRFF